MNPFHSRGRPVRSLLALPALLASSIAAAVLSGCAAVPQQSNLPALRAPEDLAAERSLASPNPSATASPAEQWPSDNWWQQFGDPQLDTLIAQGVAGASDIRIAEARFARAAAVAGMTKSSLLPTLNAAAEGGATQPSDNFLIPSGFVPRGWPEYGQVSLALNWQLDFWGRNRQALAAARSEAEAARVEASAARLAVASGIAAAYAELAAAEAGRDAAENAVRVRQQSHDLMQARMMQGLEDMSAVQRARSALAAAQGDRAAADEAVAHIRNGIAALMGQGPDRGLTITRPHLAPIGWTALPAQIPANLLGRRPDVIAARLRAEGAASRIRAARAAFYPDVNLAGIVGFQALGLDNVFTKGSDFGTVGPALNLPLFNGGRLTGQYRAAEAEYALAVAQYDGALVQALREVADAAASQQALGKRLEQARAAEHAAQAAWTIAGNRYRGGLSRALDVLDAEDALIAARRTVALLESRAFAVDVALIRALGGGYRS